MPEPNLTLYVRRDCHLCAEMHAELEQVRAGLGFALELVDVDADPALAARYGHKVPVLAAGDFEICHYFLDQAELRAWLESGR
ncbi:MAG: glutaredoxin family protein [Gammaproteobacteria bacterium]|nr:glutaredoxin family protein [Gammaproteobacteria bacterium]